ncbi:hypothetical protein IAT38_001472 [Cryptococcus sp. DSM 104549]
MPVAVPDKPMEDYDASSPQVMNAFYRRLFPYKPFFNWINQDHVPQSLWRNREFAFTLPGDIYSRYNAFTTLEDFKKEVIKITPSRFEIGPQYNVSPSDRKSGKEKTITPLRRELVFDIDMTDYDEIRTCCTDKKICKRCWGFIAAAVKVLDRSLREDFGFKHLLWVYSGRRGIHCWISDQRALDLTDDQRRALVTFLEVVKGGKEQAKKVNVRGANGELPLHPSLTSAVNILGAEFARICLYDQNCFGTQQGWESLLAILPADRKIGGELRAKWKNGSESSSEDKWNDLLDLRNQLKDSDQNASVKLHRAMEDIILQYTYPRIDAEVSKHKNHLLKSPFCVHPGTGRVCVPVDPARVEEFDPATVPTVGQLLNQLDNIKTEPEGTGRRTEDYEHTSLRPYVEMFEKHTAAIVRDNRKARNAVKQERGNLDF